MIHATLTIEIPPALLQELLQRAADDEPVTIRLTAQLGDVSAPVALPEAQSSLGQRLYEQGLSPRQIAIIELDRQHHTRAGIARQLDMRPRTVDWHWEQIKHKLDVTTREEVRSLVEQLAREG